MAGEALVIGGLIELAKMGLMIWMQASQMAQLSEAERDRLFEEVKVKFHGKPPANLPDV